MRAALARKKQRTRRHRATVQRHVGDCNAIGDTDETVCELGQRTCRLLSVVPGHCSAAVRTGELRGLAGGI
jgi:hypothetical protein